MLIIILQFCTSSSIAGIQYSEKSHGGWSNIDRRKRENICVDKELEGIRGNERDESREKYLDKSFIF